MEERPRENQVRDVRGNVIQGRDIHIHGDGIPARKRRRNILLAGAAVAVAAVSVTVFLLVPRSATGTADAAGPAVGVVVRNAADPTNGGVVYALPDELAPRPAGVTVGPQLAGIVADDRAAELEALHLTVILTGRHGRPVAITDIRAVIRAHRPPLAGTLLYAPAQSTETAVEGCIMLGAGRPVLREVAPDGLTCDPAGHPYFADHFLALARDEPDVINLTVTPEPGGGYTEFTLVLDAVVDGKSVEIPVTDGSMPFRVTSYAAKYAAVYRATTDDAHVLHSVDPAGFCGPSCADGRPHG